MIKAKKNRDAVYRSDKDTDEEKRLDCLSTTLDILTRFISQKERKILAEKKGGVQLCLRQILALFLLLHSFQLTIRGLASATKSNQHVRDLLDLKEGESLSKSTVHRAMQEISPETLEELSLILARRREKDCDLGDFYTCIPDTTAVPSWIITPHDSKTLYDLIRVGGRVIQFCIEKKLVIPCFLNKVRKAKSNDFNARNRPKEEEKIRCYGENIDIAREVKGELEDCKEHLEALPTKTKGLSRRKRDLERFERYCDAVIDQAEKRVIHGEKVSNEDKVLSIFEDEVSVIEKGNRETTFGVKVNVTRSSTGTVLDVEPLEGNQADTDTFLPSLERAQEATPHKIEYTAADGGYASLDNHAEAEEKLEGGVYFGTPKGMTPDEMMPCEETRKVMSSYRSSVEATISHLKRTFGLSRLKVKGRDALRKALASAHLCFNALLGLS